MFTSFMGQYEHSIDEKGRMTIPARYRELLITGAVITLGFDENLWALRTADYEEIEAKIGRMNPADPNVRQLARLILSHAEFVEPDRLGRILLPQFLRDSGHLTDTAVVVGVGRYFEIWSRELWSAQVARLHDPTITQERLALFDLSHQ